MRQWDTAQQKFAQAMRAEGLRTSILVSASSFLTCLGVAASTVMSQFAVKLIFGFAIVFANVGIVIVSRAWRRAEKARRAMHHYALVTVSAATAEELEFLENKIARFRRTRLIVAVGALSFFAIADLCFALYY